MMMKRSLMYISALASLAIFSSSSLSQTSLGDEDLFSTEPISMGSDLFSDEHSSTLAFFNDVVNLVDLDPDPDPDPDPDLDFTIASGEWCSDGENSKFFKKMHRRRGREDKPFCINDQQNVGDEVQIPDIFQPDNPGIEGLLLRTQTKTESNAKCLLWPPYTLNACCDGYPSTVLSNGPPKVWENIFYCYISMTHRLTYPLTLLCLSGACKLFKFFFWKYSLMGFVNR